MDIWHGLLIFRPFCSNSSIMWTTTLMGVAKVKQEHTCP